MHERGIRINKSYQLDAGGGIETNNTVDEDLRVLKRKVKSTTIESELPYDVKTVSGTTDYVDFMGNSRTNYLWLECDSFLGSKVRFDIYLRSTDGPNAGVLLLDIIRGIDIHTIWLNMDPLKNCLILGLNQQLLRMILDNHIRISQKNIFYS